MDRKIDTLIRWLRRRRFSRADPAATVIAFDGCINARDVRGFAALMAQDHTFIDTAGGVVAGRSATIAAWTGFFAQFPDYRNVFDTVRVHHDRVVVRGRSVCSVDVLDGPVLWSAKVADDVGTEWRVHDDTSEHRAALLTAQRPALAGTAAWP